MVPPGPYRDRHWWSPRSHPHPIGAGEGGGCATYFAPFTPRGCEAVIEHDHWSCTPAPSLCTPGVKRFVPGLFFCRLHVAMLCPVCHPCWNKLRGHKGGCIKDSREDHRRRKNDVGSVLCVCFCSAFFSAVLFLSAVFVCVCCCFCALCLCACSCCFFALCA